MPNSSTNLANSPHPKIRRTYEKCPFYVKIWRDITSSPGLYLMLLPVLVFYFLFRYKPMYGVLIAFTDYYPGAPILDLENWVGFENFIDFFKDRDFWRLIKNTLTISLSNLIFGFPVPIIFALLLNELKSKAFSRVIQTLSYLPYFISMVVICGLIRTFTMPNGIITQMLIPLGLAEVGASLLTKSAAYVPLYVSTEIWQGMGYASIIYLAALTGVSQELYEAATVDGAGRWKSLIHITLPGILPTIVTMLILRMGNIMSLGFEKTLLLYSPQIYDVSDIISTFVYRAGLQQARFSFSTAVGLFNSLINLIILFSANAISRKFNETSLW